MRIDRVRKMAVVAVVGGLVLAGCGTSGGDDGATTPSGSAPTTIAADTASTTTTDADAFEAAFDDLLTLWEGERVEANAFRAALGLDEAPSDVDCSQVI